MLSKSYLIDFTKKFSLINKIYCKVKGKNSTKNFGWFKQMRSVERGEFWIFYNSRAYST